MKKVLIGVLLVAGFAAPASAVNLLINGDWSTGNETGWTRWWAPWGASNYAVTSSGPTPPEGTAWLNAGQQGSFGWWQGVAVPVGTVVTVDADWTGNIGGAGWAEVMLWSQAAPGGEGGRADTGNAADIAFKKDSWGMNPPTAWSWQKASLSPHPSGNGGTVVSQGYVVVALKLGSVSGSAVNASWDNIVLTPEPAAALLLGLPLLFFRRRRA